MPHQVKVNELILGGGFNRRLDTQSMFAGEKVAHDF